MSKLEIRRFMEFRDCSGCTRFCLPYPDKGYQLIKYLVGGDLNPPDKITIFPVVKCESTATLYTQELTTKYPINTVVRLEIL